MKIIHVPFIVLILLLPLLSTAQVGLEVGLNAGASYPMGTFKREFNFANSGYSFNTDVDYYFGVIGFGLSAGVTSNNAISPFQKYMDKNYNYQDYSMAYENWLAKYIVFGPSLRLDFGDFKLVGYGKLGFLNLSIPNIDFYTLYFDQSYQAMKYWGDADKIMGVWFGGIKGQYKFTPNISMQLKGELITTKFFSGITNSMIYRDVKDKNTNGRIDETEFFAADDRLISTDVIYSNLVLSAGVAINVGGGVETANNYVVQNTLENPYYIPKDLTPMEDEEIEEVKDSSVVEAPTQEYEEREYELVTVKKEPEIIEKIPENLDSTANKLMFKAGKTYLENEQFDDALYCFRKLADSKDYPLATFYESLTLLKMDKCREGEITYARFRAKYPHENTNTIQELFQLIRRLCKEQELRIEEFEDHNITDQEAESSMDRLVEDNTNIEIESHQPEVKLREEITGFDELNDGKVEIAVLSDKENNKDLVDGGQKDLTLSEVNTEIEGVNNNIQNSIEGKEVIETAVEITTEEEFGKEGSIVNDRHEGLPVIENNEEVIRVTKKPSEPIIYKVQFTAMNRSNHSYKRVEKIGKIIKEYFPDMDKYRYMLGGYNDLEKAKNDMKKVRKLGFVDAFIAIYKGEERIVTFYHPE